MTSGRLAGAVRWLVAATVVFQVSATIGMRTAPPETVTAVRQDDAGTPLRNP